MFRIWYHPELQLGRCMLQYANKEYPHIMRRLKIDTIANIVHVIMAGYGNGLLSDNRDIRAEKIKQTISKAEMMRSNEIGYAARTPSVATLPVVSYLKPLRFTIPWYNYNYNRIYNARPLAVQQQYTTMKNNGKSQDHSKPSTVSFHTNNTLHNLEMIESEDQPKIHTARKSRSTNDNEIVPSVYADVASKPNISTYEAVNRQNNDFLNFETILLDGLGIDPNSIEKWSPFYCGKEYVIDVMKRAEESIQFRF